jgi:predicted lipoprotein
MTPPRGVKLSLSGPEAERAARDLFSSGWFEAELERRSAGPNAPTSLVCAQVEALAGGSVTIADKVLAWWDRWGKPDGAALEVTLEGPAGLKVSLASATRDSLVEVLRVLHTPRG